MVCGLIAGALSAEERPHSATGIKSRRWPIRSLSPAPEIHLSTSIVRYPPADGKYEEAPVGAAVGCGLVGKCVGGATIQVAGGRGLYTGNTLMLLFI